MPVDASRIWPEAKLLLLPYEGAASQLYILDVPLSECGAVIDLFAGFVEEPEVVALDSHWDKPRSLNAELRTALLSRSDESTTPHLRGVHEGASVALYLWLHAKLQTFDVELVFWSDQLFPQPDDESACLQTFAQYVDLAERIRSLSAMSHCVLSASETGDPRDDRGKLWTCWW